MDARLLEGAGLTLGESKAYLALLSHGVSTISEIANTSGVSRSKLYGILHKLETKGLVGHVVKKRTTHFRAAPPERIINYLDEREKERQAQRLAIERLLPALKNFRSPGKTEATLFEGVPAIQTVYRSILTDLSAGDTYYVIGANYGSDKSWLRAFFERYHADRAAKGISVHMLANEEVRNTLVPSTHKNARVRFLPQYLVSSMTVVVYGNKSFLFFLTDAPVGFLIENKEVANGFRTYFKTFWRMAEP